jgi:hypothetical protein
MPATPTARTLDLLRREGWLAAVVERYNAFAKVRVDLYGFGDVIACRPGGGVLLVQCTSASNHAARVSKAISLPALRTWLASGGLFSVWSWRKSKTRWLCRRQDITAADLTLTPTPNATPADAAAPAAGE